MSPSGRNRKMTGGGGNTFKRGSVGGGPVGGGGRPSGGSSGGFSGGGSSGGGGGTRGTGSSLLGILAAILIGKAVSGGNNNGNNGGSNRSGCLKRILILLLAFAVVMFLVRTCRSSNVGGMTVGDLLGGGTSSGSLLTEEPGQTDDAVSAEPSPALTELFTGNSTSYTGPSTAVAYAAHEADYTVDSAARAKRVSLKGGGKDTVTILVYMCGTDLESSNGMGTADLKEMIDATISDQVNLIVETGGASSWKNSTVSSRTNQRYQVKSGGLVRLDANVGKKSMVDPNTLADFIQYGKANFPADRTMLILWDHGGGSITGYGYDELFSSDGSMTLDEIGDALKAGGCTFDFIGFDACLMGSLETALVLEPYADYMIGSEATEPGCGWYYTDWLSKLSQNTSMSTVDVGKNIIDDFVSVSAQVASGSPATLSIIDLAELSGTVPAKLTAFSEATSAMLDNQYAAVSGARSSARDFSSSSKINQIDMIHFLTNLGTDSANALANALSGCVKYNRCGRDISNANGVTVYFPYQSLSKVSMALNTYTKIGMDQSYTACIKSFASMTAGGQVSSGGSTDALGSLLGSDSGSLLSALMDSYAGGSGSSASASSDSVASLLELFLGGDRSAVTGDPDSSWVDEDRVRASAGYYESVRSGFDALSLTSAGGQTVLPLTAEQWGMVKTLEMNVFVDDGEGYIDLGFDPYYVTDGLNLVMDFDGNWITVNGQNVACYFISEDSTDDGAYTILYRVPAQLNGVRVNLILSFTGVQGSDEDEVCTLLGAQTDYTDTETVMKGLVPVVKGDKLQFLCDYYTYEGAYSDTYELGYPITATDTWEIGYATIGNVSWSMCYRLTDVYNAQYWTPAIRG